MEVFSDVSLPDLEVFKAMYPHVSHGTFVELGEKIKTKKEQVQKAKLIFNQLASELDELNNLNYFEGAFETYISIQSKVVKNYVRDLKGLLRRPEQPPQCEVENITSENIGIHHLVERLNFSNCAIVLKEPENFQGLLAVFQSVLSVENSRQTQINDQHLETPEHCCEDPFFKDLMRKENQSKWNIILKDSKKATSMFDLVMPFIGNMELNQKELCQAMNICHIAHDMIHIKALGKVQSVIDKDTQLILDLHEYLEQYMGKCVVYDAINKAKHYEQKICIEKLDEQYGAVNYDIDVLENKLNNLRNERSNIKRLLDEEKIKQELFLLADDKVVIERQNHIFSIEDQIEKTQESLKVHELGLEALREWLLKNSDLQGLTEERYLSAVNKHKDFVVDGFNTCRGIIGFLDHSLLTFSHKKWDEEFKKIEMDLERMNVDDDDKDEEEEEEVKSKENKTDVKIEKLNEKIINLKHLRQNVYSVLQGCKVHLTEYLIENSDILEDSFKTLAYQEAMRMDKQLHKMLQRCQKHYQEIYLNTQEGIIRPDSANSFANELHFLKMFAETITDENVLKHLRSFSSKSNQNTCKCLNQWETAIQYSSKSSKAFQEIMTNYYSENMLGDEVQDVIVCIRRIFPKSITTSTSNH